MRLISAFPDSIEARRRLPSSAQVLWWIDLVAMAQDSIHLRRVHGGDIICGGVPAHYLTRCTSLINSASVWPPAEVDSPRGAGARNVRSPSRGPAPLVAMPSRREDPPQPLARGSKRRREAAPKATPPTTMDAVRANEGGSRSGGPQLERRSPPPAHPKTLPASPRPLGKDGTEGINKGGGPPGPLSPHPCTLR